jgi:acetolactate synthase I/II/III large subunit
MTHPSRGSGPRSEDRLPPDKSSVADAIVAALTHSGIKHLFYVPGGPLMPLLGAFERCRAVQTILCRHEAGAGLCAEGLARTTRSPAVVAVTAGPGVTNLVTAAYVAYCEWTPVLILSAQVSRKANGRGAAQELDTVTLLRPVTKRSESLVFGSSATQVVRDLLQEAQSGRPGPVHLSVAADQWREVQ